MKKLLTFKESMENSKKYRAFMTIDYNDGDGSSFRGIVVTWGNNKKSFNTGDPLIDWYDYYKWVYGGDASKEGIFSIGGSSTSDHWFMDTDDYIEKYIKSDDGDNYEFVTSDEIDRMSFKDMDDAIKCVVSKQMKSFKDLKDYYKKYHKLTESVDQSTSDEWVILSFKGLGGIVNVDPASVNRYLGNKLFTIYSVKRLPDGEIFTIGDKVGIGTSPAGSITKMWVSFDQMRLDVDNLGLVLRDFTKKF